MLRIPAKRSAESDLEPETEPESELEELESETESARKRQKYQSKSKKVREVRESPEPELDEGLLLSPAMSASARSLKTGVSLGSYRFFIGRYNRLFIRVGE